MVTVAMWDPPLKGNKNMQSPSYSRVELHACNLVLHWFVINYLVFIVFHVMFGFSCQSIWRILPFGMELFITCWNLIICLLHGPRVSQARNQHIPGNLVHSIAAQTVDFFIVFHNCVPTLSLFNSCCRNLFSIYNVNICFCKYYRPSQS